MEHMSFWRSLGFSYASFLFWDNLPVIIILKYIIDINCFFNKFLFCYSMQEMEIINHLQIFINTGKWNTRQFYAEFQYSFVSFATSDGNII